MGPKSKTVAQPVKPFFAKQMIALYKASELELSCVEGEPAYLLPRDMPMFKETLTQYLLFVYFSFNWNQLEKIQVIDANLPAIREVFNVPKLSMTQTFIELESYGLGSIFDSVSWWAIDNLFTVYPYYNLL